MSEELERRWDDAVETAWREFRQRLADHLAGMVDGDSIVVEVVDDEVHGTTPYCQVAAGEGILRVEAVSNAYLALECQLDEAQEVRWSAWGSAGPRPGTGRKVRPTSGPTSSSGRQTERP